MHAIPELNSPGSAPKPAAGESTAPHQGSGNVGGTTLDADDAATYESTKEVLTQPGALTPGSYLHIGRDGYLTLQSVPASAWLLLAVHDGSSEARTAATNRWVRSNAADEAPLSVPTRLAAGEYAVTVQEPEGVLVGFAALAIAEEVLPTE
ncbi:hypothetical protein [Specibacter sp. NPDC078709]|uniref:hypothetical protein n=1 Tax=Specibacter sp. NPDC078709 TaxID=3154364 RepID=UPI00342E8123